MPLVFEQPFKVLHTETDPWGRMTPGAVLRRVQEIATAHCESLGIDQQMYDETHTAFILSKISLRAHQMPALHQAVRLQTRAYAMQRALFYRMTTLHDEDGKVLCSADARWVLVNTERHHILRRPPEGFYNPFDDTDVAHELHDMHMPKPGLLLRLDDCYASYTLCDSNGHLNNTRYADLICDHLPLEPLRQGPVGRMVIFYKQEIPLAHSFSLMAAPAGSSGYYFTGLSEGKRHFEAFVEARK